MKRYASKHGKTTEGTRIEGAVGGRARSVAPVAAVGESEERALRHLLHLEGVA